MTDLSGRTAVRVLSPDEIERMLAEHQLYLETEYHEGAERATREWPFCVRGKPSYDVR